VKDFADLANMSGGGLYHHATTGLTTMLTESKETLPLSDTFSGRRSVDGNGQNSFYQPNKPQKGLLTNTLKESVLQPAHKQSSEGFDLIKKT
jgi:hypothetical protein